jgi:hypothetical protein
MSELKAKLTRLWEDAGVRSANHFLIWEFTLGEPNWCEGRFASLRQRKPRRKVSRRQSQETQHATL